MNEIDVTKDWTGPRTGYKYKRWLSARHKISRERIVANTNRRVWEGTQRGVWDQPDVLL
jgi:hypothetical protein